MLFGVFSDPHLGLSRATNTTLESRKRFREFLYDHTMSVIDGLLKEGADKIFCLGDLFDSYSNDEATFLQGFNVLQELEGCLVGNHDIANRLDSVGTLQALQQIYQGLPRSMKSNPVIYNDEPHEPRIRNWRYDLSEWTFVPHVFTQELFCQSLELAEQMNPHKNMHILCLHCNVGVPGYAEVEDKGTSLYLTEEWQERLLKKYDLILVGHEHPPKTLHDSRVVVLGNVYPLAFGEVADRYSYIIDDEQKTIVKTLQIFKQDESFKQVQATELLGSEGKYDAGAARIVEVTGTVRRSDQAELARSIAAFWKNNDGVFLFRNATKTEEVTAAKRHENTFVPKTLPELVSESVANTPYREAYDEAVDAVRSDSSDS